MRLTVPSSVSRASVKQVKERVEINGLASLLHATDSTEDVLPGVAHIDGLVNQFSIGMAATRRRCRWWAAMEDRTLA